MDAPEAPSVGNAMDLHNQGANDTMNIAGKWNNYNVNDPYQTIKWIKTPNGWKQKIRFKPGEREIFEANQDYRSGLSRLANQSLASMSGMFSDPISFEGAPEIDAGEWSSPTDFFDPNWSIVRNLGSPSDELGGYGGNNTLIGNAGNDIGDWTEDRRRIEDAIMARHNERFAADEEALYSRLAAEGFNPGDAAAQERFHALGKDKTDAWTQAILAGGTEQSRLFDLMLRKAGFANAAQGQGWRQAMDTAAAANQGIQWDYGTDVDAYNRWLQSQTLPRQMAMQQLQFLSGGGAPQDLYRTEGFQQGVQQPDPMAFLAQIFGTESQAALGELQAYLGLAGDIFDWLPTPGA